MLNQHEQLEGRLQDLRAWVGNTSLILNKKYNSKTDADSLNQCLQHFEVNSTHSQACFICPLSYMNFIFQLGKPISVLIFLRKSDFLFQK